MNTALKPTSWHLFREKINLLILNYVQKMGPKNRLRDACEYALTNGGKRFRPALVLLIAHHLNPKADASEAALAVEFCHTASLIADDLPCMDDDALRRDLPSLHMAFDEQTALLASYALIAEAYGLIAKNAAAMENGEAVCQIAVSCASYNTGVFGASGGQYLDLVPPDLTEEVLEEVLRKKTVSLFEISFVFGWLFGGGDINRIDEVKQLSYHFGMAFQIADDLDDQAQDRKNGRAINMANVLGEKRAKELLGNHLRKSLQLFEKLDLQIPELLQMTLELKV